MTLTPLLAISGNMAWDFTHSCHQEPQRNFGWLNVFIMSVWKRDQLKNSKMAVMVHGVREEERSVRSLHTQLQILTRRLCSCVCSWARSTELCELYPLCPLIAVRWPAALHCLNLADNWNRDTGCLPRVLQCCYTMPSNIPCGVDEEREMERTHRYSSFCFPYNLLYKCRYEYQGWCTNCSVHDSWNCCIHRK